MHGYLMHNALYQKASRLKEPWSYETYRAAAIEKRLAAERSSRIGKLPRLPKVGLGSSWILGELVMLVCLLPVCCRYVGGEA